MIVNHDMNKYNKQALIISFLYVSIGTLAVCAIYPADPLYGEWSMLPLLLTFPVTFISFGYRFSENANDFSTVYFIQLIMQILTYNFVNRILKRKYVAKNKSIELINKNKKQN